MNPINIKIDPEVYKKLKQAQRRFQAKMGVRAGLKKFVGIKKIPTPSPNIFKDVKKKK